MLSEDALLLDSSQTLLSSSWMGSTCHLIPGKSVPFTQHLSCLEENPRTSSLLNWSILARCTCTSTRQWMHSGCLRLPRSTSENGISRKCEIRDVEYQLDIPFCRPTCDTVLVCCSLCRDIFTSTVSEKNAFATFPAKGLCEQCSIEPLPVFPTWT